jgi:hypothetical protein
MTEIGILELSPEQIDALRQEVHEKGGYIRVMQNLQASDAAGWDVTDRFKRAKPDSVYQAFRKAIKDGNGEFENIAVVKRTTDEDEVRVIIYRTDYTPVTSEDEDEQD